MLRSGLRAEGMSAGSGVRLPLAGAVEADWAVVAEHVNRLSGWADRRSQHGLTNEYFLSIRSKASRYSRRICDRLFV